ncbi:MAG: CAP domain-containing protein [Candidatus Peregrinibacteria bacterium]
MFRRFALIIILSTIVLQGYAQAPIVTRVEAVLFLFQISQKPLPTIDSITPLFADVPAGTLQERVLQAAVERGMIGMNPVTGNIDPAAPVTRGEYLRMLAILFGLPTSPTHHFIDIPRTAPYAPYVGIAERCRLFPLEKQDSLKPEASLLINEAASAVYTLMRCYTLLLPNTDVIPAPSAQSSFAAAPQRTAFSVNPVLIPPILPFPNATEQRRLQIIALVNQERMAAGLQPLVRNPQLEQAAQAHAKDMYKRGYFSHFSPEGSNYIDRIRTTAYLTLPAELCPCQTVFDISELLNQRSETSQHYLVTKRSTVCSCNPRFALGENIARGQQTAPIAVEQWMDSTSHRQAILQPLFRETGVGVYGDVWVQEFGSVSFE